MMLQNKLSQRVQFLREFDKHAGTVLLLLLVIIVTTELVSRYVLASPFTWGNELARYLLIWITFVGVIAAVRKDKHLRMTFLISRFSERGQKILRLVGNVLVIVFLVALVRSSIVMSLSFGDIRAPALRIPTVFVFSIIPITAAVILGLYLNLALRGLRDMLSGVKE